jgi:tetratricopeptide (TPR) repeat protein
MGKRSRLIAVVVCLATAPAIYYLGSRLISRSSPASQASTKPANPHGATVPDAIAAKEKEHEVKMLKAALQRKPDHVPMLFRLAQLSQEAGKPAEAIGYLRQVVKQEPNNADALLELGKALFETGDIAGALQFTRKILEKQPDHPGALYNLGAVYANLGDSKAARQYWNRLIASHPKSENAQRAEKLMAQLSRPAL